MGEHALLLRSILLLVFLYRLLLDASQIALALEGSNGDDNNDEHIEGQKEGSQADDDIAQLLLEHLVIHELVQKHEVVHDQDQDTLVEDLKRLGECELVELSVAYIDQVQQGCKDHKLDLDTRLVKQGKRHQDKEGPPGEEHR